ncbi:hypothetical protein BCR43DRAFT_498205 [Syncephalastrum racemosum]|uniref:Uncharacterized protein n=1 Tax=Syncephalastrum racemosum TaxID=13706 RepID=A0A1X2H3F8_SYNRA|nr:hypothetical protein BCR43DRAFT_498205 [Syncephalastrum racemosum]
MLRCKSLRLDEWEDYMTHWSANNAPLTPCYKTISIKFVHRYCPQFVVYVGCDSIETSKNYYEGTCVAYFPICRIDSVGAAFEGLGRNKWFGELVACRIAAELVPHDATLLIITQSRLEALLHEGPHWTVQERQALTNFKKIANERSVTIIMATINKNDGPLEYDYRQMMHLQDELSRLHSSTMPPRIQGEEFIMLRGVPHLRQVRKRTSPLWHIPSGPFITYSAVHLMKAPETPEADYRFISTPKFVDMCDLSPPPEPDASAQPQSPTSPPPRHIRYDTSSNEIDSQHFDKPATDSSEPADLLAEILTGPGAAAINPAAPLPLQAQPPQSPTTPLSQTLAEPIINSTDARPSSPLTQRNASPSRQLDPTKASTDPRLLPPTSTSTTEGYKLPSVTSRPRDPRIPLSSQGIPRQTSPSVVSRRSLDPRLSASPKMSPISSSATFESHASPAAPRPTSPQSSKRPLDPRLAPSTGSKMPHPAVSSASHSSDSSRASSPLRGEASQIRQTALQTSDAEASSSSQAMIPSTKSLKEAGSDIKNPSILQENSARLLTPDRMQSFDKLGLGLSDVSRMNVGQFSRRHPDTSMPGFFVQKDATSNTKDPKPTSLSDPFFIRPALDDFSSKMRDCMQFAKSLRKIHEGLNISHGTKRSSEQFLYDESSNKVMKPGPGRTIRRNDEDVGQGERTCGSERIAKWMSKLYPPPPSSPPPVPPSVEPY